MLPPENTMGGKNVRELKEPKEVPVVVALIHSLNWVDAVLTMAWLTRGVEEINPVMDLMFRISPGLFIVCKLVLITVGVEVIRRYAEPTLSKFVLYGICLIFAAVVAWHIAGALIVSLNT